MKYTNPLRKNKHHLDQLVSQYGQGKIADSWLRNFASDSWGNWDNPNTLYGHPSIDHLAEVITVASQVLSEEEGLK